MSFKVEENGQFRGQVTFLDMVPNAGCIANSHVNASAAIAATKLEHQHREIYAQESGTTAATETRVVHVVHGATGTLRAFAAGCVTACIGDSTITVDLLVNGASVLTAAIGLSVAEDAYELLAGTIDTAAVTAEDVIEVAVTATVGTGTLGEGVFAYLDLHEDES